MARERRFFLCLSSRLYRARRAAVSPATGCPLWTGAARSCLADQEALIRHPCRQNARAFSATTFEADSVTTAAAAAAAPHAGALARLPLSVPAYSVWGANTNVGKTMVSVGLAHAAASNRVSLSYIKPVQTGFPADSDARLVALACGGRLSLGDHAAQAEAEALAAAAAGATVASAAGHSAGVGGGEGVSSTSSTSSSAPAATARCSTLFAWRHAVSPHLAVRLEGRGVTDERLVTATALHIQQEMDELLLRLRATAPSSSLPPPPAGVPRSGRIPSSAQPATAATDSAAEADVGGVALLLLETAGGVTSPAPSGRLTCDALRPLRLPAVLVGDPRLGGIAATLSAYDSLIARGWDVEAVVLLGQATAAPAASAPAAAPQGLSFSTPAAAGAGSGGGGGDAAAAAVAGGGGRGGGGGGVPLDNLSFIREHFSGAAAAVHRLGAPPPEVVGLPACPPPPQGHDVRTHGLDPALRAWLSASLPAFSDLLAALRRRHQHRAASLLASAAAAEAQLWWPFTQHAGLARGSATIVDGRCGETWTALAPPLPPTEPPAAEAALVPLYDASGSWWTQAATPALQSEIARAVSYAAGRYLHVLFAEVAHAPALAAAGALLAGPGAGWAERVFFSDDGSTAVEVALKMAFRKFLADRGELAAAAAAGSAGNGGASGAGAGDTAASFATSGGGGGELVVLGLHGAYHGDTLGAQDCVAPSVFNGPLQSPWYRGRGLFLRPPYVGMRQGCWRILDPPDWLTSRRRRKDAAAATPAAGCDGNGNNGSNGEELPTWGSLEELLSYDRAREGSAAALAATYRSYIEEAIDGFEAAAAAASVSGGAARVAACIMEPLLQGAGGMLVVEPGFQRTVAEVCRARRLPLVLDEVFSGLYRTGSLTAAGALGLTPDVACYGKLLTGGAAPMAVTLASGEVFNAFRGSSKLFALLHGHSYTAYPVGCAAAVASLELLSNPDTNPNVCAPRRCPKSPSCASPCGRLLPLWDEQRDAKDLSYHPLVSRVAAVGTVLAVELAAAGSSGGGYGSASAVQVVRRLREAHGIYARPLGNVVYLMVPPTARRETAAWLAASLRAVLDWCSGSQRAGADPWVDSGSGGGGRGGVEEEGVVV